ncbi:quinoprotein dehydrogenase-associated SoxYZ-like carrier [Algiphilus sp.]|uniref:quinoprotein dehydrogenase-associated SoxYZ-like carrier n=1 Tax=Algiphilus sp. TaxID=1872431 RepID=UPI0032EC0423
MTTTTQSIQAAARVVTCAVAFFLAPSLSAAPEDPLKSPSWSVMETRILEGRDYVFDDRVSVTVPAVAEDSTRVPVFASAQGFEAIQRMVIFVDLNPITSAADLTPATPMAEMSLGLEVKVQQATPVRAAVLDKDGVWHIGGGWVSAAGGGCTAPSIASARPDWRERLGQAGGRVWAANEGQDRRLSFTVRHPMDAGFVAGLPELYLDETVIADAGGNPLFTLRTLASVSEDPNFTLRLPPGSGDILIRGRDNNANRFSLRVPSDV